MKLCPPQNSDPTFYQLEWFGGEMQVDPWILNQYTLITMIEIFSFITPLITIYIHYIRKPAQLGCSCRPWQNTHKSKNELGGRKQGNRFYFKETMGKSRELADRDSHAFFCITPSTGRARTYRYSASFSLPAKLNRIYFMTRPKAVVIWMTDLLHNRLLKILIDLL